MLCEPSEVWRYVVCVAGREVHLEEVVTLLSIAWSLRTKMVSGSEWRIAVSSSEMPIIRSPSPVMCVTRLPGARSTRRRPLGVLAREPEIDAGAGPVSALRLGP